MRLSLTIMILIGLMSCKSYRIGNKPIEKSDPIADFQQYMVDEINFARTKPSEYAALRLKVDKSRNTDNGSYQYLNTLIPSGKLSINNSLHESATNYATFLAKRNTIKHYIDGTPLSRAVRNDYKGTLVGENLAAHSGKSFNAFQNPQSAAIGFVRLLIIDQWVEDFGHRKILFDPEFTTVGTGFGQDTTSIYINYVVQDFGNL